MRWFNSSTLTQTVRRSFPVALLALAVLAAAGGLGLTRASEEARDIPAPAVDEQVAADTTSEVAVLAGGCFWGVQGVFQHVDGVLNAVSGYTGGEKNTAHYEMVSDGDTNHAESVQITFDPHKISYGHLLQIYFSVAHNPTELNYQGPDHGTQYRSAIFPMNGEQARVAKAYIDQLGVAKAFDAAIVTKIEPGKTFYVAEDYHQDFLTRNPGYPYIAINDMPKIANLKQHFAAAYREQPVLVMASRATN